MEHLVIHKDAQYHSAFPHIIRLHNGDLVCVFRQAPVHDAMAHYHVDPASRIALVRSTDDGRTWRPDSRVVVDTADGSQDLNMARLTQLATGELLLNNHRWRLFPLEQMERTQLWAGRRYILPFKSFGVVGVFESQYIYRSLTDGETWGAPRAVAVPSLDYLAHTGYNEWVALPDGTLLMPLHGRTAADTQERFFIVRSRDGGQTWGQPTTVAHDPEGRIAFHEPPLLRLPDGRLQTMIRTAGADGYLYQAFSEDDGWTWQGLKRTPVWGHPAHLLHLDGTRVVCTYGYRREPFGVRALLSTDGGATWPVERELVIRKDGQHRDLGYPTAVRLRDGSVLCAYYFHGADGIRYIGGSIFGEDELG